jgi:hypothetical protein
MKALLLIATVAAAAISFTAPLSAAPVAPALSLEQMMDGSMSRHGCDTPHDIAQHPRCTK